MRTSSCLLVGPDVSEGVSRGTSGQIGGLKTSEAKFQGTADPPYILTNTEPQVKPPPKASISTS
jgi:hypothetical protein